MTDRQPRPPSSEDVAPLEPARFAAALAACGHADGAPLAVACSGGADSLAVALLAADWAMARGVRLAVLSVDHGLRPEAAAEAETVVRTLSARGVEAHALTLTLADMPAGGNLQARARAGRYRRLLGWCRAEGIGTLLTGHHLEDQAETFLLRLARGSGVDGLAAMAPAVDWGGVRVMRPLLDVPKARLAARVRAAGLSWVEDPSNADPRFARVRLRAEAERLAALGLDAETLARTARRMGRARAALASQSARLLAEAATVPPEGYARLDAARLVAAPEEIGLRALAALVERVGGRVYPPRLDRLERLYGAIAGGTLGGGRTLAGVSVRADPDGRLLLCREAAAVPAAPVPLDPSLLWDGRFVVDGTAEAVRAAGRAGFSLAPLGRDGWSQLRRSDASAAACGERLPGPVRPTLPAFWRDGALASVPHLQAGEGSERAPGGLTLRFAGPETAVPHFS